MSLLVGRTWEKYRLILSGRESFCQTLPAQKITEDFALNRQ